MSKRKLLLADDSETVQKVVNLTFELEGIEVVTFGDGDSAMSQFSAVAPDVVLADVNMPGLDGYQICQNIKNNESTKNTPVILLVGSFEPFDEQRAMQVGADDYLTKPFQSIRQLVSKVNELLAPKTEIKNDEIDEIHFNDTLEMKETHFAETTFGEAAMDDEMIQTNQIGSIPADETAKYLTPNNPQFEGDDDGAGRTQPLSAKDWQDIYSQEKRAEESSRTVYELADEPDEFVAVEERKEEQQQNFAEPEKDVFEPQEEHSFSYAAEKPAEEPISESYEVHDFSEHYAENSKENELGIQPDDIDHFYREPDYDDEETVDMPIYSKDAEQHDFQENKPVAEAENKNELESSDRDSVHDSPSFSARNELPQTENTESETEKTESVDASFEPEAERSKAIDERSESEIQESEAETERYDFEESKRQTERYNFAESERETEFAQASSADDNVAAESASDQLPRNESQHDDSLSDELPTDDSDVKVVAETVPPQFLSTAPILDFDELDLLEVSFPEDRPTSFADVPAHTEETSAVGEMPRVEETIEIQNEPETENVKSEVAEQLSGVNLSAADIEAIADKVVEKLTARLKE